MDIFSMLDRLSKIQNPDARREIINNITTELGKFMLRHCKLQQDNIVLKEQLHDMIDSITVNIPEQEGEEV